ncbi:MAG: hypothetical protein CMJ72_07990 [Planctomycetaceae bacterium]|nr:hypothetical protein [Planctomycetaceae bacterium]HCK42588.1 hypothetical protein [Planctomycetaceae bacterium]
MGVFLRTPAPATALAEFLVNWTYLAALCFDFGHCSISRGRLDVSKKRLRLQASQALPEKYLEHLATKRMKYPG